MASGRAAARRWPCLQQADFAAVLATPARWRSPHFAVHALGGPPRGPAAARLLRGEGTRQAEISTGVAPNQGSIVDISAPIDPTSPGAPAGHWLGLVVPKRHARRAVTRNLLKRQMRRQVDLWGASMPAGRWVIRLRAPFPVDRYPSAASAALCTDVRRELDALFAGAFAP